MSPSVSAVPNFNVASVRDGSEVNSRNASKSRSTDDRDSFARMLRSNADDQRSSQANGKTKSGKKDKSESDEAGSNAATAPGNNAPSEKSALPITFLFGLANEPMENFDAQKSSSFAQRTLAGSAQFLKQSAGLPVEGMNADALVMVPNLELPVGANLQKSDTPVANASGGPEVIALGENGNSIKGGANPLNINALAFAMRLGSGQALSTSKAADAAEHASPVANDPTQPYSTAVKVDTIQAASGATLEDSAREHDGSGEPQNLLELGPVRTSESFDHTKVADDSGNTPIARVPDEPPTTATTEPVRNVHMQLVSEDNRRVDVRLIDRGGELHVSVKSADAALTQSLQDHLPDLTTRLEKQQMQTEVWVPKAAEPTRAESGNTNGSLSDPNARSYSGNSEGRKDGRQQGKPDWVDALETYS